MRRNALNTVNMPPKICMQLRRHRYANRCLWARYARLAEHTRDKQLLILLFHVGTVRFQTLAGIARHPSLYCEPNTVGTLVGLSLQVKWQSVSQRPETISRSTCSPKRLLPGGMSVTSCSHATTYSTYKREFTIYGISAGLLADASRRSRLALCCAPQPNFFVFVPSRERSEKTQAI